MYDAVEYYAKARSFWNAVSEHRLFNPFNLEPTLRPPGTVLMSYPIGFGADWKPFFFRSVYLPVLLAVAAVYIVVPREWTALVAALFLGSIPGFYHFEIPTVEGMGFWGEVDNFLAGVAALAIALGIWSVRRDSLWALATGGLLAAFCLTIKPAGLVVMVMFAGSWLVLAWGRWPRRRLLVGLAWLAAVYAIAISACILTQYLSTAQRNMENEIIAALHTSGTALTLPAFLAQPHLLVSRLHLSLGDELTAALLLLILVGASGRLNAVDPAGRRYAAAALVVLLGGAAFCFGVDGLLNTRYFVAFALMAAVLCLPLVTALVAVLHRGTLSALVALFLLPSLGLAFSLLPNHGTSTSALQDVLGIDVRTGRTRPDEAMVRKLVEEAAGTTVCSFNHSATDALLRSASGLGSASLSLVSPLDFGGTFAIRLKYVRSADFIAFSTIEPQGWRSNILLKAHYATYQEELVAFDAWLSGAGESQGVALYAEVPGTRVLRVVQRAALDGGLHQFVSSHQWSPPILAE